MAGSDRPLVTRVELSGPFFTRDPGKTLRGNVERLLDELAAQGEQAVRELAPVRTGAFRAGIRGRTVSLTGRKWSSHAVVSATHVYPWPGGGGKQYRGGKIEARRHLFRRTTTALRASGKIARADLTEGMN